MMKRYTPEQIVQLPALHLWWMAWCNMSMGPTARYRQVRNGEAKIVDADIDTRWNTPLQLVRRHSTTTATRLTRHPKWGM
jgi:hypothetical protein